MKKMMKEKGMLLCIVLMIMCLFFGGCNKSDSSEIPEKDSTKPVSAVASLLNSILSCSTYKKGSASYYDVDGDGTEELFVCYRQEFPNANTNVTTWQDTYEIYRISDGEPEKVFSSVYHDVDQCEVSYFGAAQYQGDTVGAIRIAYVDNDVVSYILHIYDVLTLFNVKDDEAVVQLSAHTDNMEDMDSEDLGYDPYSINGESVSFSEYNKTMQSIDFVYQTGIDNSEEEHSIQELYDSILENNAASEGYALTEIEKCLIGDWAGSIDGADVHCVFEPNHTLMMISDYSDEGQWVKWSATEDSIVIPPSAYNYEQTEMTYEFNGDQLMLSVYDESISLTRASGEDIDDTLPDYNETTSVQIDLSQLKMSQEYAKCFSDGISHTIVLLPDGTVEAVGKNYDDRTRACDVDAWSNIVEVSAGDYFSVGLKSDGTVVESGFGISFGDKIYDISSWDGISAISAGYSFVVGLKPDGTVVAEGFNEDGQCNVQDWKDITAISAGGQHTVGLKKDGTVVSAGQNMYGQRTLGKWKGIVAISAGASHTVGLKADGTVVAVGYNDFGECDVSDWKDIVAISAGAFHTVGLKADGTVVATGYNDDGQCNVSDWQDIIAINAKNWHTFALKTDGTLLAIGDNSKGQCEVSGWRIR